MTLPPVSKSFDSESIFASLRYELRDFARHTTFHIKYVNPALTSLARSGRDIYKSEAIELEDFEQIIEERYLKFLEDDNQLHFMTKWTSRVYLAKIRLLEHESNFAGFHQGEDARQLSINFALAMLKCDNMIMSSTLVQGYRWLHNQYFPFLAYMILCRSLRTNPVMATNDQVWEKMNKNFTCWVVYLEDNQEYLKAFARLILWTWQIFQQSTDELKISRDTPEIVTLVEEKLKRITHQSDNQLIQPSLNQRLQGPESSNSFESFKMTSFFDLETLEIEDLIKDEMLYSTSDYR